MKYAGYDPEIAVKQTEAKARVESLKNSIEAKTGDSSGDTENDVIIVLPDNNRNVTLPERQSDGKDDGGSNDPEQML